MTCIYLVLSTLTYLFIHPFSLLCVDPGLAALLLLSPPLIFLRWPASLLDLAAHDSQANSCDTRSHGPVEWGYMDLKVPIGGGTWAQAGCASRPPWRGSW